MYVLDVEGMNRLYGRYLYGIDKMNSNALQSYPSMFVDSGTGLCAGTYIKERKALSVIIWGQYGVLSFEVAVVWEKLSPGSETRPVMLTLTVEP